MGHVGRLAYRLALSLLGGLILCDGAIAQQRVVTAQQYIESTSPLKTGGTITSRTTPEGRTETITRIAQLPVREGNTASVLTSPLSPQSVYRVPQAVTNQAGMPSAQATYPYPATQPPRLRYATGQGLYAGSRSLATAPGAGTVATTPHVAYQATNTLGLPPVRRVAQNSCGSCDTTATSPPNLTFNVPGQTPPGGVLQTYPGATAYPNPGYGTRQNWWTPFFTGSGTYTPLLFRRNMPPGTYLGQGIIGQPTAYVDGQPIRNLLRYVFP